MSPSCVHMLWYTSPDIHITTHITVTTRWRCSHTAYTRSLVAFAPFGVLCCWQLPGFNSSFSWSTGTRCQALETCQPSVASCLLLPLRSQSRKTSRRPLQSMTASSPGAMAAEAWKAAPTRCSLTSSGEILPIAVFVSYGINFPILIRKESGACSVNDGLCIGIREAPWLVVGVSSIHFAVQAVEKQLRIAHRGRALVGLHFMVPDDIARGCIPRPRSNDPASWRRETGKTGSASATAAETLWPP